MKIEQNRNNKLKVAAYSWANDINAKPANFTKLSTRRYKLRIFNGPGRKSDVRLMEMQAKKKISHTERAALIKLLKYFVNGNKVSAAMRRGPRLFIVDGQH